jgi:hypothetical protein
MKDTKKMLRKQSITGFNLISLPTIQLTPIEADRFLDCIYDESVMKNYARFEKMAKPTKYIRHLGFGSGKFLYPGSNFNEAKYKKQFTHNRITLTAQKIRGCVPVYDDDLEEGIEGPAYKNHLMQIIAKQIANELGYAYYMGDTAGYNSWTPDDIESLWDGWRYIINNSQNGDTYYNDVCGAADVKSACDTASGAEWDLPGLIAEQDAAAPYNWEFKYARLIKNMPAKYKSAFGLKNFVFLNSDLVTQDYIEALSARSTALGDAVFTGAAKPAYGNVPIVDVPLMPTNLGADGNAVDDFGIIGGGSYTDVIFTYKNNLIIGMQKDIKIEPQRSASDECTYYFYTMKVALAIENVNAIVFLKCLTHNC